MVEVLVNETYDMITELAHSEETRALWDKMNDLMEGETHGTLMATLAPLIVTAHLDAYVNNDGCVCVTCANRGLTELLQAVRKLHDQIIDQLPESEH